MFPVHVHDASPPDALLVAMAECDHGQRAQDVHYESPLHPVIPLANALTQVALFVKEGLDELTALKAVTITAAKVNHVDDRVGSIEVGKDADIVIWNGHPFHYMTKPNYVMVNGKIVHKA